MDREQGSASRARRHKLRRRLVLLLSLILALGALFVLNVSIPGETVEGCPEGCVVAAERKAGPMRVVSLNMLHGFPKFENLPLRVALISGEIQRLDADVVLLQEVPWTTKTGNVAKVLANQLGYNYLFYRASGNRKLIFFEEGEAILSRFPLQDVVTTELMPAADPFQNRVVLGATAVTPWGEVRLFDTHLTHSNPQVNEQQVAALKRFVEDHTVGMSIVGGDFNAKDDSAQIIDLSRIWLDTYRVAHPSDKGYTCCTDNLHVPPGVPLPLRIDYIFLVHPTWKLVSAEHAFYGPFKVGEGWQWASDHTGLKVEIEP